MHDLLVAFSIDYSPAVCDPITAFEIIFRSRPASLECLLYIVMGDPGFWTSDGEEYYVCISSMKLKR